ncbi:MAG TPA: hypothetical protein VHQ64_11150, partial [Pyrinomonadaceae bacterium]|jgi:hypothetical protein|nr:hypothetical protein [Pyrinomonadaceae bacterium]
MSTKEDGRGWGTPLESRQHDPDSKGKRQGVIQSGENRVLFFIFGPSVQPPTKKFFAAPERHFVIHRS